MRKLMLWGIAAGLAICLACETASARDTYQSNKPVQKSWWSSLWPFGKKKPTGPVKGVKSNQAVRGKSKKRLLGQDKPASDAPLAAAQTDVLRRQAACDRLAEIARGTNDPAMEAQANLLQQRAWFQYEQLASSKQRETATPETEVAQAKTSKLNGAVASNAAPE